MTQAISLKPEDMSTGGGGILADTNARWLKSRFGMETYKGKRDPVPAFMLHYLDLDQDQEFDQSWSVGNAADYTPSKDGKQLIGDRPLRASSNFGMLLASLANAIGTDELSEHMGDDITVLDGMETHFFQQVDERPTAKPRKGTDGKEYPATIPLVDRVTVKPWDKKEAKAAGDDDIKVRAEAALKDVLKDNPDGMALNDAVMAIFRKTSDTPVITLITNDHGFVNGIDGVTLEGDVVKLG